MKHISLFTATFIASTLCISCANQKNIETRPTKYYEEVDHMYWDICRLYELKIKNIMELMKSKKITYDQTDIMLAEAHNWAVNAASQRFYQTNY